LPAAEKRSAPDVSRDGGKVGHGVAGDDDGRRFSQNPAPLRPSLISSDLVKLTALNEPNEFIPLGMRQSNGVCILADCDALLSNLDFRASRAGWAKCELFMLHGKPL
jgi:hypothetical protein